jgi:hypothetical protein
LAGFARRQNPYTTQDRGVGIEVKTVGRSVSNYCGLKWSQAFFGKRQKRSDKYEEKLHGLAEPRLPKWCLRSIPVARLHVNLQSDAFLDAAQVEILLLSKKAPVSRLQSCLGSSKFARLTL